MISRAHAGAASRVLKFLMISFMLAGISSAASITLPAIVTVTSPGGLTGTEQWSSGASLTSEVVFKDGLYLYEYRWSEPDKAISHIIIELCLGIDVGMIESTLDGNHVNTFEIGTYTSTSNGGSNPGLIGTLYGLKVDFKNDPKTTAFGFATTVAPMIGDVYAKDGRAGGPGGGGFVYANGTGIYVPGCDNCPPDMTEAPEPSTMALMGAGLLGAGLLKLRRK